MVIDFRRDAKPACRICDTLFKKCKQATRRAECVTSSSKTKLPRPEAKKSGPTCSTTQRVGDFLLWNRPKSAPWGMQWGGDQKCRENRLKRHRTFKASPRRSMACFCALHCRLDGPFGSLKHRNIGILTCREDIRTMLQSL